MPWLLRCAFMGQLKQKATRLRGNLVIRIEEPLMRNLNEIFYILYSSLFRFFNSESVTSSSSLLAFRRMSTDSLCLPLGVTATFRGEAFGCISHGFERRDLAQRRGKLRFKLRPSTALARSVSQRMLEKRLAVSHISRDSFIEMCAMQSVFLDLVCFWLDETCGLLSQKLFKSCKPKKAMPME